MIKKQLSFQELDYLYSQIEFMIDLLDERAVYELLSGNESDINRIFKILEEEAIKIFTLIPEPITSNKFLELDYFTKSIDESLKVLNYNYFKLTMLPNFLLAKHSVEWGNYVQLYNLLAILASRSLGKSFEFSFAYPIWKMYGYRKGNELNPSDAFIKLRKEGVLMTNKFALGRDLLKKITEEIRDNTLLHERLLSPSLGIEEISCKNGANLKLRSYDASIRGLHPGYIIVDDFLDKSCIYSAEQRNKFIDVFKSEIVPALEPHGNIVVVGTPFSEKDLYNYIREDSLWKLFEYPAIFPDGELAAPNRYRYEDIIKLRKSLGTLVFSREIMCVPIADNATIFPWSILGNAYIGMQTFTLVNNLQSFPTKFKYVTVGCDFALSANINSDSSVFSVWGLDAYDRWWLIHIWIGRGASHNEQLNKLVEIERNFKPNRIVLEVNGFQRIMADLAKERGVRGIIEFNTTGFNKKDIMDGLPGLAVLFENGQILMPRGNEESISMSDFICSQFNSITIKPEKGKLEASGGHDDAVMSTFLAIKGGELENKTSEITFTTF